MATNRNMGCDVGTQLFIEAEAARASSTCKSGRHKSPDRRGGKGNRGAVWYAGYIYTKLRMVRRFEGNAHPQKRREKVNDNVTINDVLKAKGCARGALRFCRRHGLDEKRFFSTGLPISELEHINDAMLKAVIEVARGRE